MKSKFVSILTPSGGLNADIKIILSDLPTLHSVSDIHAYAETQQCQYSPDEITLLQQSVKEASFLAIEKAAVALYQFYRLSNQWDSFGSDHINLGFFQILLQTPANAPISPDDTMAFYETFETRLTQYQLQDQTQDQLLHFFNTFSFEFLGLRISSSNPEHINLIFKFLMIDRALLTGIYDNRKLFILAKTKSGKKSGQFVCFIKKELMRTPNAILAMAAFNSAHSRELCLREDALRTIFYQKWAPVFGTKQRYTLTPEFSISEGIKSHALSLFNVTSSEELDAIKGQLIKDVGETVIYHEIGHIVVQNDILPTEVCPLFESTQVFGDNILLTLLEIMADFSPTFNQTKGAFQNMVDVNQEDPTRATRLFYLYLSDIWFYDTPDTFMYPYSDILSLTLLRYINDDLSINFKKIQFDLQFDPATPNQPNGKKSLVSFFFKTATTNATLLRNLIESLPFKINNNERDYAYIKKLVQYNFTQSNTIINEESYHFLTKFWTVMMHNIIEFTDQKSEIMHFFETEQQRFIKQLFVFSAGKATAEQYQFDHRQYIFDRFISLELSQ